MARAALRAKSPTVITTPGTAHTARTDSAIAAADDNNHFDLFMNSPLVAGPVPMRPFAESYVQIRTPSMHSCDSLRGNRCGAGNVRVQAGPGRALPIRRSTGSGGAPR